MDHIDIEKNMGMDKFITMHMERELLWLLYYYRHIHIPYHGPGYFLMHLIGHGYEDGNEVGLVMCMVIVMGIILIIGISMDISISIDMVMDMVIVKVMGMNMIMFLEMSMCMIMGRGRGRAGGKAGEGIRVGTGVGAGSEKGAGTFVLVFAVKSLIYFHFCSHLFYFNFSFNL